MIEMEKISAGYGKNEILHDVDFRAAGGEVTTLIGTNGSGKSTLLKVLLGFLDYREGEIRIDGVSVKSLSRPELARIVADLL